MMKEVEIEALRPFNKTPQGDLCEVGDRFTVGEVRAGELARLGLAQPMKGKTGAPATSDAPASKAAPEPDNKMAVSPANKFARTGFSNRGSAVKLSGGQG